MVEPDTVKLLRECDAGVKMGISSIDDVLDYVRSEEFKRQLTKCKAEHEKLEREIDDLLNKYHDDGKAPSPMAQGMSWIKTNVKLAMNESDGTIADLMTDGCNMGVKSLSKYLNQYKNASEESKNIARQIITSEKSLNEVLRYHL